MQKLSTDVLALMLTFLCTNDIKSVSLVSQKDLEGRLEPKRGYYCIPTRTVAALHRRLLDTLESVHIAKNVTHLTLMIHAKGPGETCRILNLCPNLVSLEYLWAPCWAHTTPGDRSVLRKAFENATFTKLKLRGFLMDGAQCSLIPKRDLDEVTLVAGEEIKGEETDEPSPYIAASHLAHRFFGPKRSRTVKILDFPGVGNSVDESAAQLAVSLFSRTYRHPHVLHLCARSLLTACPSTNAMFEQSKDTLRELELGAWSWVTDITRSLEIPPSIIHVIMLASVTPFWVTPCQATRVKKKPCVTVVMSGVRTTIRCIVALVTWLDILHEAPMLKLHLVKDVPARFHAAQLTMIHEGCEKLGIDLQVSTLPSIVDIYR
ncbi:hypothetical protein EMMF5_001078 [Cystobasidiomycetes sp. EMM_F5]